MLYLFISAMSGIGGGLFKSRIAADYSLGTLGNLFTGFLGGVVAHLLVIMSLGGTAYSVSAVGGFLGGVLVRVAFTVIRQRIDAAKELAAAEVAEAAEVQ